MNRTECYAFIKANPAIKELIKTKYGINYTNIPTDVLDYYIGKYINSGTKVIDEKANITPEEVKPQVFNCEDVINKLLDVLVNKKILIKKEKEYILKG